MGLLEMAPHHGYSALSNSDQQNQGSGVVHHQQLEAGSKVPTAAVPLGGALAGDLDDGLQPDSGSSSDSDTLLPSPHKSSSGTPTFGLLDFARFFGTGLLASVSYLDPGNLEADIQLGVASGMTLLWWTGICCLVFGFTFQCISGRLGLVTGRDLAMHLGERYPKGARYLLWILIEIAIIGADIQETIGSALAISILSSGRMPLWAGCILVSVSAFLLLLVDRIGFRHLEAIFGVFIAIEAVAMFINFVQADIPAKDVVIGTFVPYVTRSTMPVAVASLGALVMPYNIYFQSAIVNARPRDGDTEEKKSLLLKYMRLENFLVLILAFVVNLFVIGVFAEGFYGTGEEVGLESAGDHLATRYGPLFQTVWAIGLLASGQVATIGLTHAGQLVMMGLLNMQVQAGPRMIATRLVALIPTVTLAVLFEASHTFDQVAQFLNVVQAMMLPFALIPVLHVCADQKVMGRFVSHPALTFFAGLIAATVAGVNGYLMVDFLHTSLPETPGVVVAFSLFMILYYLILLYFSIGPDNIPAVLECACGAYRKGAAWMRAHRRHADFESMLEVHF